MLDVPTQLAADEAGLVEDIDALIEKHGGERDSLIPVLQDLRAQRREISSLAMQVLADRLDIPPVEVHGVVSFYTFLQVGATGQHVIRLCRTLSCEMAGAGGIAEHLEKVLGVPFGSTTEDGKFTLEWANCIGMCDQAPAMLADERAVGSLTVERVTEIIDGLKAADKK
jgi:NADH:ubiquinone oxidoreductase subunit E